VLATIIRDERKESKNGHGMAIHPHAGRAT